MSQRPTYSRFFEIATIAFLGCVLGCAAPTPEGSAAAARPALIGDYLGQTPPGAEAELFAPGVVSTGKDELNAVFSPDGHEFLFTVKTPDRARHTLLVMKRDGDAWSDPTVLPFSGRYNDADPAYSPDGDTLYFISRRPVEADAPPREDWDLWIVQRTAGGWGEPYNPGPPLNTEHLEVYPSVADDGTLYFSSGRPGGKGKNDIYRSRPVDGGWAEPENLGDAINTEQSEGDLYIAPDESYIVFVSSGREEGFGAGDLYVSHREPDGSWRQAINLGEAVNTRWTEYCPVVSRDGRYLFFTSYRVERDDEAGERLSLDDIERAYGRPRGGFGDVYWMDAAVLGAESAGASGGDAAPPVAAKTTRTGPVARVLGTAQDGGLPHVACGCVRCERARADPGFRRLVASLGVVIPGEQLRVLIDATPDVREQLHALAVAAGGARDRTDRQPVDALLLTHAHMGHYLGLAFFGFEAAHTRGVPLYSTPSLADYLAANGPWDQLVRLENVVLKPVDHGGTIRLHDQLEVTVLPVPHREEYTDTVGFLLRGPNRSLLYVPDTEGWDDWDPPLIERLEGVDVAILDGTFYSLDELPGRDLSAIGHPLIEQSMELLQPLVDAGRLQVWFTHLNHSNPALDPSSPAAEAIRARGFGVAADGQEFPL